MQTANTTQELELIPDIWIQVGRDDAGCYSISSAAEPQWTECETWDWETVEDLGELRGWGIWERAYRVVDRDGDTRHVFGHWFDYTGDLRCSDCGKTVTTRREFAANCDHGCDYGHWVELSEPCNTDCEMDTDECPECYGAHPKVRA